MSISNLSQSGGLRWMPDADSVNAPEGVLLRADNLVPDREGALTLRRGSSIVLEDLGGSVDNIYTTELDSTKYRALQADDALYINGVQQATTIPGSGDIAMGTDSKQMFFARGTWRKKWDGTALRNWSIPKPVGKPELAAVAAISKVVAEFDNSESPAVTQAQGGAFTVGDAEDKDGTANKATTANVDTSTYRSSLRRLWTTDQDYFNISGVTGSETDLFTINAKLGDPRNIESVKIIFGLDDSSTKPFASNRFEFTFQIKDGIAVNLKDQQAEGYDAYDTAVGKTVEGIEPQEVTGIRSPSEVKQILEGIGEQPSPKSNYPESDVWGTLTVTRGQFDRIGNDAGRGWTTVRGFKVVTRNIRGKTDEVVYSDAIIVGGGGRTLTGTYKCVVRGVRDFDGEYYELGPPSEESDAINLNHQTLQITINGSLLNALDEQCDQVWVYLFGGWLDAYYRFAVTSSEVQTDATLDELKTPVGSNFDDADKRARITTWGGTVQTSSASSDIILTLRTSELDALTENIRLEPYQVEIPKNVIDIAGPWRSRMFVLTSEGYVYPTGDTNPSSVTSLHLIDCTKYGDPKWLAKTGNGIYVGCEKDVVFLAGTGDISPDFARIDLYAQPLNLGNPPVDSAHYVDGNTIIYRSEDGLMSLTGGSIQPLPDAGTSLLWRGQTRHDVEDLNVDTGRFRMAIDNHMFYMLAPEGDNTSAEAIYRYSFPRGQWSRLTFPQAASYRSIYTEYDGTILLGDSGGTLWELETGTQDNSVDIPIFVRTPIEDGGQPLAYKDAFDLQLHVETNNDIATVLLYKDGGNDEYSYSASTGVPTVWRQNISDFGKFIKAQMEITGNFNTFRLNMWNLSHRIRPQRTVYLDTGYYTGSGDAIWVHEIEVDAIAMNDFTVRLFFNDEEFDLDGAGAVTATTGNRDVYQIPVPRGAKGERPRVVVQSDTTSGMDVGFDPYMIRMRIVDTGNQEGLQYKPVWPAGQLP